MAKNKIVIVGIGMIGVGLAANAMMNGYETVLYSRRNLDDVRKQVEDVIAILVKAQAITPELAKEALTSGKYSNSLEEAVVGADLVQECLPERLEMKQSTYVAIQKVTGPNTIIASATSSLFPTNLQEGALYPESIIVGHPYNPSYLIPLIEICGGKQTSEENIEKAIQIYKGMGKVPIVCRKEINGFIVNRLSWAAMAAAQESVKEGVCSVEDMDKAIMFGPGLRMAVTGQLLTMSLGVDGGFRAMAEKYGKEPSLDDEMYAKGVDEEIANRDPSMGNTVDSVCEFRDYMFAQILKMQRLL